MATTLVALQIIILFFGTIHCYPVNNHGNNTNSSLSSAPTRANQNQTQLNPSGRNRTRDLSAQVPTAAPDEYRWPGGIVHFKITGEFNEEQLSHIRTAQHTIANRSENCIQFQEATPEVKDYLVFLKTEDSCSSSVGREGGVQYMELCNDCFVFGFGSIAHELMHVIGFHHEHVRSDRDAYVVVHENLILPDKLHDFAMLGLDTFDLAYDYDSILHYPRTGFGINGDDETITPKDQNAQIGQRDHLSDGDVAKIRKYYGCE